MFSRNKFVSYAQNFEDVILWRLLAQVDSGFYIDIGAQHPFADSATQAFYERNWSGINVEPHPQFLALLNRHRTRDVNLGCLVGSAAGTTDFYRVTDGSGLSTGNKRLADNLKAKGIPLQVETVEVVSLAEICEKHAEDEIHFLKVDAEGMEQEVVVGMDFEKYRPWVIVIEAFEPNSRVESHGDWEDLLIAAQYEMVYADGLNRFYLAKERGELKATLDYPPNVFDHFETYSVVERDARLGVLERAVVERDARLGVLERAVVERDARLGVLERAVVERDARLGVLERAVVERDARLGVIVNSISWKFTFPIRSAFPLAISVSNAVGAFMSTALKRCVSIVIAPLIGKLLKYPRIVQTIKEISSKMKLLGAIDVTLALVQRSSSESLPSRTVVLLGQSFDLGQWSRDAVRHHETADQSRDKPNKYNSKRSTFKATEDSYRDDVGVIVSLYKCEEFLDFFLQSLVEQSIFSESQIYIGAVLPTEMEYELLTRFRNGKSNVTLEILPYRAGIYEVWNRGIQKTTTKYLTNMNVDDLRRNDSLELQAAFLNRLPSIDVVYQDFFVSFEPKVSWDLIASNGMKTSLPNVSLPILNSGINPPHNAPMWRRQLHNKVGMFDESFKSAGDFDFWVRSILQGGRFLKMSEIHTSYFFNQQGLSTVSTGSGSEEVARVQAVSQKAIEVLKTKVLSHITTDTNNRHDIADSLTLDFVRELLGARTPNKS